jgi:uncharacterized low-complexity protein
MKHLFTLFTAAIMVVAFAANSLAEGSCGSCPADGKKKDKDKTEEGATQS